VPTLPPKHVGAAEGGDTVHTHNRDRDKGLVHVMSADSHDLPSESRRNLIVWWFLGFATNLTWVANNAGAGDIVPGSYALIYLSNQVPSVLVKATGPYWFDRGDLGIRSYHHHIPL